MSHFDKSRILRRERRTPSNSRAPTAPPRKSASPLLSKTDALALMQWLAAIIAAAAVLLLSRGTSFHQLAIGVISSLICIFVGVTVVEGVSRLASAARVQRRQVDVVAEPPDIRPEDDG